VDEFWKKRDPDPSTEINEFKEEYFRRLEIPLSLPEGQYAMTVLLENSTGEEAVRRYMTFKI
jgi:hypothetical protein